MLDSLEILFENKAVVLVNKPVNYLTTPARDANDDRPCLGRQLQTQLGVRIYPVHRLDFEVGGLVLFAKTADAHRVTQAWFETGSVIKTYQARSALTEGSPREFVEWSSVLAKGKRRAFAAAHGKTARTRAKARVNAAGDELLWDLMPLTGRAHQLRFEMANRGWPILGDVLYGGVEWEPARGIGLRAYDLDFREVGDRFGLPARVRAPGLWV